MKGNQQKFELTSKRVKIRIKLSLKKLSPLSDVFEDFRELLPDLEDHGATHDDLDLLNEVLGDPEYQALGDVSISIGDFILF